MRFLRPRYLTTRLFIGLVFVLTIGQLGFTVLRSNIVWYDYERTMLTLAADKFAHQAAAVAKDPGVELPADTPSRFQRVDLIWRAEANVFEGFDPGSDAEVAAKIKARMVALDAAPTELFALFARSTKFDGVQGGGGNRYRGPVPPMETLVAARLDGVDGWITARLRGGPPPPPVTLTDIGLNVAVILALGLIGIILLTREMRHSLSDLRGAVDGIGESGATEALTPSGPKEFHPIYTAFNKMSGRVQDLLSEKDVMLGAIGHDLRTPLTSLRLSLEKMEPVDARDRAIATIEQMGGVLEDILELARSDHAAPPTTRYDIAALIEDVVMDAQERGEAVSFDHPGRVTAPCRPDGLRRMMQNLIGNAVKYAGHARVSLSQSGDALEIAVEDDGPGLPKDLLETITEPFRRGDQSRNAKIGGTGLGLTLARAVARTHGGDMALSNRQPAGLSVRVKLPRRIG